MSEKYRAPSAVPTGPSVNLNASCSSCGSTPSATTPGMPAGDCAGAGATAHSHAAAANAARIRFVTSASPRLRRPALLAAAPPLLAKPHLPGQLRARGRVARRHHGIVGRKTPLLAVLLRRDVVLGAQVALE